MFKMASMTDKSNKLLSVVVNNKTMADAKNDVVDIDSLRQFTIPKMRKAKHELLENVSMNSIQYQREILQVLQQSYQDGKSIDRFIYSHPKLVHNAPLLNEFLERRKTMRQDRTEKELQDTYGFIAVKTESEAKKYCAKGITIGNSSMTYLGNPAMGVYLCKAADILQPTPLFDGQSGFIVIFKIIKGKTKLMVENRVGEPLDPTPDFDCHLSKSINVDSTTVSTQEAYESTQLYIYEYTEDLDITERPRQVVPHAVVSFRFVSSSQQKSKATKKWLPSEYCSPAARQASSKMSSVAESASSVNSSLSKRLSTDGVLSATSEKGGSQADVDATDSGDIIWTGQLCMESAVISDVELVSYSTFNLPWHLDPWLNVDHDRISYDEIVSYYQLELLTVLHREQECRASGKFYNYCELRPMSATSKNFLRAVNLISKSRHGSRIKLTKGVDLIILPHCTITYQLGLCPRRPERVVLHCIIISTMSSAYQQDITSRPYETANQISFSGSDEFPLNSQVLESGVDLASDMHYMPYQEQSIRSQSSGQSLQFMQSYPNIPASDQTMFQHGSIPFSLFPATTPGEAVQPSGLSSTADVPFSLSNQRHHDPRLARRLEMPSEFLPHITSDDVLRLNLPAFDLPPAFQMETGEGIHPEQGTVSSAKRIDSLQERIDRLQAEMDARASPGGYYQSDADTETEYSPLSQFRGRGSSSSNSEEDEELVLDIIKLRRPTALVQPEKNSDEEQTNEETMEVDEGNMADDLVDEIVRMKPLQAKAARETFGGPSTDPLSGEKVTNAESAENISLTDRLYIDFDSEDADSSDVEEANDDDLSVIKSSLLISSSAKKSICDVVNDTAVVVTKPTVDVTNQEGGLSNEPCVTAGQIDPSKTSEEPKQVPEILSPISSEVRSKDNSQLPVHSVGVTTSPRAAEETHLSSTIALANDVVESTGLAIVTQPETCPVESLQVGGGDSRVVTFVETGKLSIEIHSDVLEKSAASDETAGGVLQAFTSTISELENMETADNVLQGASRTTTPAPEKVTGLVIEEDKISSCVAKVLHRGATRRQFRLASSREEEEADHQRELVWQLGLHYLAFFLDGDDDDNREINAEEVPNIRSMTDQPNAFVSMFSKESARESNRARPVRHPSLSSSTAVSVLSAANKSNHVQQSGICSSNCTTDVARQRRRRSRSISSSRQDSSQHRGSSSHYDDERYNRSQTRDHGYRNDRYHPYYPYYRRQDNTRARIDRDEFYKVYREERNLEELLQCLTKSQFESRRTRPILTHLTSDPSASESTLSSPRFKSHLFHRSTFEESDAILGRREKVDDCLEDEMFDKDQVPNFYDKKAIADAIDGILRPPSTESQTSQRHSKTSKTTCSAATSVPPAEGSPDAKSGEVTEVKVSSAEFSCLSFTNSQSLIPFLEDVASPLVDDSVATVDVEGSACVDPRSDIQFCRTGRMEMKWPSHLTTVDIPVSRPDFRCADVSSHLLELISAEIISSCDPRLSPNVPNSSVYANLDHGAQSAPLLQRGSSRQGLSGEDRSMEGLGEELREMAKNLKVRVHINPKFLPILADRAAIAGGNASVASLLQGRMGDTDKVQGANHETLSLQKKRQGSDPVKDRKLDDVLDRDVAKKKVESVKKLPPRRESETEERTSLNSEQRSSGVPKRAAEGQFGHNLDMKGSLMRVKVDPDSIGVPEFNQDRLQRNEMERDENERLIAEVVRCTPASGIPSEPTLTDSQKAVGQGTEDAQTDFSPEILVSIKQERHSGHEDSSDGSFVTDRSRGTLHAEGNRVASDLMGADQGQELETEGSGKGGTTKDSSTFLRKQDKQKLKEEVLLLEKMVAEKKALQVERENRERNGGKLTSKERLQQRIVAAGDRETGKSQQKSATGTADSLQQKVLPEEKPKASAGTVDKLKSHGIDERRILSPSDRAKGLLGELQTSSVAVAPSGESLLRRNTGDTAKERAPGEHQLRRDTGDTAKARVSYNLGSTRVVDHQVKPSPVPRVVEEKLSRPMSLEHKSIALKSDSQEKRIVEDQRPKGEITVAHESVFAQNSKKKEGWPERQTVPALFPAFQNSNILQPKDKVPPAISSDFEQPLRIAGSSQGHSRLAQQKTDTLKLLKEREEQKRDAQKHAFQSPECNMEVMDAGLLSLARTPVDVTDPVCCNCGSNKGKKAAIEQCEFCLRRQLLGNSESISKSSSALADIAKIPSPDPSLPSASLEHEAATGSVHGEPGSDADDIPPTKDSTDGESLDAVVDNTLAHLPCLCPETQFESQFYDCASVRRIHLEVIREWMRNKPLEMLICGRLKDLPRLLPWLPVDIANDQLMMDCMSSFSHSMNEILEELIAPPEEIPVSDAENVEDIESIVVEHPCATEQLAFSLFEEVRQHLEFLSEKSLLQNMDLTGQPSDEVEGEVHCETVAPRVRGPDVLQTIPVLQKPSKYSKASNTDTETKAAHLDDTKAARDETKAAHCDETKVPCCDEAKAVHCDERKAAHCEEIKDAHRDETKATRDDVSVSEVLPSDIAVHSSPQQMVRDEENISYHEQLSSIEDAVISQAQSPVKEVVRETKTRESVPARNYRSDYRVPPHSTSSERLRERGSADVARVPRSHEMERSWRRGVVRGRDIPLRRRGFDSERRWGRETEEGRRGESMRYDESQYPIKPLLQDLHRRRKHSRSRGDDRNGPKATPAAGKVEDHHEPKRSRLEKVKEPNSDLEIEDETLEKKLEKAEALLKKLEKAEPLMGLDFSEVKGLRKGAKKAKKNKKEKQDGDGSKKVKEKREKKKVKKKKKAETEQVADHLHLDKPADSKIALSHLLSDAAESAFAQVNTDSGSAFARLNDDDMRKNETDLSFTETVETQAALDFRNLFKSPSDVKTPQADPSISSPPLMQCFLDKNIDYTDVMQKLSDVIPGTGKFDAKRLTPQTSFIWALALAVFKDEGKAGEAVEGSKFEQDLKQNLFDEACHDFIGEDKYTALESYQSVEGEAAESGDKTSAQKSPGGRGSNLMQAFRQVVEAKKRAQELTKSKLGLSKLSPEQAAKRAAPKAAKPLFKPPTTVGPLASLRNSRSRRFMARPEVVPSAEAYLAEKLAKEAFIEVCSELQLSLEEICGLNNPERTVPPPLTFYLMYTHFAPLSLIAISLYKSISALDEGTLAPDEKTDVDCGKGSSLSSLKRKRTDADFMVCALLKKPREQKHHRTSNKKNDEDILQANLTAKSVASGNNAKVDSAAGMKSIYPPYVGSTKDKSRDLYLHDYLPASDDCDGINNFLTDESESPTNEGNHFMNESDNTSSSVAPATSSETSCLTAESSHQRFLNAKGPRFMQTFRQNQIAKRKSQKENLRTATGGKLLHSKQQTLSVGVVKPKSIGMTLEETLAVLSGHHSPVSNTTSSTTPANSGTAVASTDVNTVSSRGFVTAVVPTTSVKGSSEDLLLPIETVTTARSSTAHPLEDLTAIPLPPAALQDDSLDAMDLGSPSESSATVELGVSLLVSPATIPYVAQPISCSTSFGSSFLISSSSDCYSGYEVSCAFPSGHLTSYLVPPPPTQMEDTRLEDSSAAMNIQQPPYSVSSAADSSQMMNSDWQYEYFPPPVDPPPGPYPPMSSEQSIPPPCMMPPHFSSPRPYLLETPTDIQPFPCLPNELPPRYPHPCPDQRAWENSPHPPPQPFSPPHPPHPPQGLPWRGVRPPPPMNMRMPPDGGRLRFRPPPPGVNPNSPMGPKRLLLRPPSSSSARGGLLPHPTSMPPPFAAGFRERSASDPGVSKDDGSSQQQPLASATDIRMFIFNRDKAICKSIQRFLEFLGARAFDPYNIATLHIAADDNCMVLIHERDFGILHKVPNLLSLKRDARVMFSGYTDVMDVKFKKFIPLFPSAGLIVFDNAALLSCKSGSLQTLFDFVHLETKERKSWTVFVSPQIMSVMDSTLGLETLSEETNSRLVENKRLVAHFTTLGVVQQMTDSYHPLSSLDYQMNCIALQSMHCRKYRHFIFITDFPKSHPDSDLFLNCGIDMMNIPEFLSAFVGQSVDQPEQLMSGEVEAHKTKLTGDTFADSRLSSAVDFCVTI